MARSSPAAADDDVEDWAVKRARGFERVKLAEVKAPAGQEDKGEILVSAPGKVILFGEHAVVHGVVSETFE